VAAGDMLYFTADDGVHGTELWRSDGTEAGTVMLNDFSAGVDSSGFAFLTPVGDKLYFQLETPSYGRELAVADAQGARIVRDLVYGTRSSGPRDLVAVGDQVAFKANNSDGLSIWISDGTPAGTRALTEMEPLMWSHSPLVSIGNTLFYG